LVGVFVAGTTGVLEQAAAHGAPWIWVMFVIPFVVIRNRRRMRGTAEQRRAAVLPLAFDNDLRFHLSPDAEVTLPPPPEEAPDRDEPARRARSPQPGAPEPAPAPKPVSRHAAVLDRARGQLQAFEEALDAARDELPDAALRDLRATLHDLGTQVEGLGRRALALESELANLDDASAAAAVDRVEARLERLQTLSDAGRDVGADEVPKLKKALAAHREVLEQAERLEGRLTLVIARLLETGAAAARARMELVDQPEPARSAEDLFARLKQQTDDARTAIAELDRGEAKPAPLPREPLGEADRRRRQPVGERGTGHPSGQCLCDAGASCRV